MLERISNPFSVYGDYEGKEATSIDWNRAYVTDFYSKSAFEAKWGKDRKASSFETGSGDYDANWFKDKRIRVAERWLREEVPVKLLRLSNGSIMYEREYLKNQEFFAEQQVFVEGDRETKGYKVKQRLITGTDILEENDWLGKYIPIVPMYGEEVNINGVRHFISLVRRSKDSQRLYNYQRTLSAELGGLQPKAPWLGPKGMFDTDHARWQTANRVNHPYLEYDVVPEQPGASPTRIPFAPPPVGATQEAMMASDDIKATMGMYDASLGAKSNETSGKAIIARQREGDTSTFDYLDNRNRAVEHGGRIILDLIPKVYTAERMLRCVQEDGTTYTVPVNQPVAPRQELERLRQPMPMQPGMPQGMPPQMPQPGAEQAQGQQEGPPEYVPVPPEAETMMDPQQREQLKSITKVFDLTTGKYDVLVTAGPSFTTRREESATQMMEFIRIFPQAAPLIGDLLAKSLDWPGSEQVAERLKAMLPPQAQGQINPMVQQLQQMLQQQDGQAKQAIGQLQQQIAQLTQQANDKRQEIAIKGQELQVKQFEAETRRAEVMKPEAQQAPEQVDPIKVAELQLKEEELRIKAYEAETARLQALGVTSPAVVQLVQQTVAQAMSNGKIGEAAEVPEPEEPAEAPEMPMAGPEMMGGDMHQMPDGSVMPGPPMGGM
jgi:hypothetical protein